MPPPRHSGFRAAILAASMSLGNVAPVDLFRFLRVPAIHWILRRTAPRHRPAAWRRSRTRPNRWRRG